jgi:rare lipoprotein A
MRVALELCSAGWFRELSEYSKVVHVGGNLGRKTMVRPLVTAMALACASTSALAESCIASHYGYSGGKTASGERMNPSGMTAAHRTRSFGSHVTVTSHASGRSVTVRINDRGPFVKGRCIDLSTGAARALRMAGLQKVSLR